jgi:16S rRNA (guanine(966)-N(2))-methyltransferase RsmD
MRDAVREALFSILGEWVVGKSVLDLYAGTGSIGLEALSRGAERAVFVELDPRAVACIEGNVDRAGFRSRARVECADVLSWISAVRRGGGRGGFQGIFADPPFAFSESPGFADFVAALGPGPLWGMGECIAVIEVESHRAPMDELEALPGTVEFRAYGRNLIGIARRFERGESP